MSDDKKLVEIDLEDHRNSFQDIIKKYGLDKGTKADEIADLMTGASGEVVSAAHLGDKYGMQLHEAVMFTGFIQRVEFLTGRRTKYDPIYEEMTQEEIEALAKRESDFKLNNDDDEKINVKVVQK